MRCADIWLDRDLQWPGLTSGKRGRTPLFSDAAIQFCLTAFEVLAKRA